MDIHAEAAWDIFTGDPNGIIGIIDVGVDITQPDISNKIVFADNGYGSNHGTGVAGIAAAQTNNSLGVAGVDWQAKILAKNPIDNGDDVDIYNAIVDAVNYSPNVRVLNNSWVVLNGDGSPRYSTTVANAFAYAYKANTTSVVANGNFQQTFANSIFYPAGLDNVIAVGATDPQDNVAYFSQQNNTISVVAPGVGIYTTDLGSGINNSFTGTSAAAPFVSGLASLLKGYNTNLANDDIKNIIELSADRVPQMHGQNFRPDYGYGRINAATALGLLKLPNTLNQFTSTGGTDYSTTGLYTTALYSIPNIADGYYFVNRHEVRQNVTFPYSFCNIVGAWGRGVGSVGFSASTPNYGEGFTDIVPGTLTNIGATLRTYVYEIYAENGTFVGYYPQTPANVTFAYTVLGIANYEPITGGTNICQNSLSTYTVPSVQGFNYSWSVSSNITIVSGQGTNSIQVTYNNTINGAGTITLNFTNSCGTFTSTLNVQVGPPDGYYSLQPQSNPFCTNTIGNTVTINQNVPNVDYFQWGYVDLNSAGPPVIVNPMGTYSQDFDTFTYAGTFEIYAREGNSCGLGNTVTTIVNVSDNCNGGGFSNFAAFPNPAGSTLTITSTAKTMSTKGVTVTPLVAKATSAPTKTPFKYQILDSKGKIWRQGESTTGDDLNIDVTDIPNNTYFLHLLVGKNTDKRQIIIQH